MVDTPGHADFGGEVCYLYFVYFLFGVIFFFFSFFML